MILPFLLQQQFHLFCILHDVQTRNPLYPLVRRIHSPETPHLLFTEELICNEKNVTSMEFPKSAML